ncbi:hypothetical protein BH09BAC3_BH09BAC3_32810 [soil metagenome]
MVVTIKITKIIPDDAWIAPKTTDKKDQKGPAK